MRTVLKNCTLLDGTKDMLIQNDMDIVFENGKITEIGKVNAKKGDVCYDLNGKYVIPVAEPQLTPSHPPPGHDPH